MKENSLDIVGNIDILIYEKKNNNISSALAKDHYQLLININFVICSFSSVSEKSWKKKINKESSHILPMREVLGI